MSIFVPGFTTTACECKIRTCWTFWYGLSGMNKTVSGDPYEEYTRVPITVGPLRKGVVVFYCDSSVASTIRISCCRACVRRIIVQLDIWQETN